MPIVNLEEVETKSPQKICLPLYLYPLISFLSLWKPLEEKNKKRAKKKERKEEADHQEQALKAWSRQSYHGDVGGGGYFMHMYHCIVHL